MRVKIILVLVGLIGLFTFPSVASANSSGFNAGNIISDEVFYNKDAMSVKEIQAFLNNQVPACDTWGQKTIYGTSRKQYAINQGWGAGPYVCLQNYYENPNTGETSFEKGGGAFEGGISSAQIIWDAAQKYGINPQALLVILKKEQGSLFSDDWPLKSQYRYAMGYACPDSGPNYSANCASNQAGFYKQMNMAAWQLQRYKNNINEYQYRPGRTNYIQYSTQPSCGGKNVYIENIATASLYIYTPYTPNDAAIANYPGEAPCGAYGNRNFYFFFKEWFGEPKITSSFVRSESSPTVYLISDDMKYPVPAMSFVNSASNLGDVQFVSQEYLNNKTTGPTLSRLIRSKGHDIYFYDSNKKYTFPTCEMVSDYGYDCSLAIRLTDDQISKLTTSSFMKSVYKNNKDEIYLVKSGSKSQAIDLRSLSEKGYSTDFNILTEEGTSNLRTDSPIFRQNVIISNGSNDDKYYSNSSNYLIKVNNTQFYNAVKSKNGEFKLNNNSIQRTEVKSTLNDIFRTSSGSYVLSDGRLYSFSVGQLPGEHTLLADNVVTNFSSPLTLGSHAFIKSVDNSRVYLVHQGVRLYINSMDELKNIAKGSNFNVLNLSSGYVDSLSYGGYAISPMSLVKFKESSRVYVSDGYSNLIPLNTFYHSDSLGISRQVKTINSQDYSNYKVSQNQEFLSLISYENNQYIGLNGEVYKLDFKLNARSVLIGKESFEKLTISSKPLPKFFRNQNNGNIFLIDDGKLRYINSMDEFHSLGGSSSNMLNVSQYIIDIFR